jgi:hypothetical protein
VLTKLIDRLITTGGDWNAQLFRELKSRLTIKNFVVVSLCSLLAQVSLLISSLLNLPTAPAQNIFQTYCRLDLSPLPFTSVWSVCQFAASDKAYSNERIDVINWTYWWESLFIDLSGIVAAFLVVVGVYLLAKDLRVEEKRGTMNFVRLSPQSAWDIFVGKFLGVPILIYLAAGLVIPLQLVAGFCSNFGLFHTIIWDFWWLVIIESFYLGAILLSKILPIVIAILAWGLQYVIAMTMMYFVHGAIGNSFSIAL